MAVSPSRTENLAVALSTRVGAQQSHCEAENLDDSQKVTDPQSMIGSWKHSLIVISVRESAAAAATTTG